MSEQLFKDLYPFNDSLAEEMARLLITPKPAVGPADLYVDTVMEEFRDNGRESEYHPDGAGPEGSRPKKGRRPGPPRAFFPRRRRPSGPPAPPGPPKFKECAFCKKNGECASVYREHYLRDEGGLLTCPILRKYVCPICGAFGDTAHTVNYCPKNPKAGQDPYVYTKSVNRRDIFWRVYIKMMSRHS